MATIYRKTEQGHDEIKTRARRLAQRLRSALILVDGKRSVDELRGLVFQDADETLEELASLGFIEPVPAAAVAAPPPALESRRSAEPARTRSQLQADFANLRRQLVREFSGHTGPAGDDLAMRLEKAADATAMRPLLLAAAEFIDACRGARAAAEFKQRYIARLDEP